ncbi:MAG: SxtJ family membrane protein [Candidatus Omnitrophica bacterium]|nr:SxtJ family membrane protein [Candidatus Omnitrophota bacterium]MDD5670858.1 SxtJ family membrane protein [Candidatus Omnitrophota bacterium]
MLLLEEIRKIESSKEKCREFAYVVGIACLIFGALFWWRQKDFYPHVLAAGGVLIVLGWTVPMLLKPLQKVWMTLALMLGWVMSRVILSLLFFLAITPIALILRFTGKDLLDTKYKDGKNSYWHKRSSKDVQKEDHEKQF